MKKFFRTIISIIMVAVIVVSLTACNFKSSDKKDTTQATGNGKDDFANVPREISCTVIDLGEISAEQGTLENNKWTKWITEQTNIKVKWVPIVRQDFKTKMGILFASGSAPDLIADYNRAGMASYKDQGVLQPIGKYLEKYSTAYNDYIKSVPELIPYTKFDGETYAWTFERPIRANHCIWIRQDWLDTLGLKVPTTDKEMLEVARAFKQKDPDRNGKNDTIGFAVGAPWGAILSAAYFAQSNIWYVDNGQPVIGRVSDRYADYLDFRKTMYDEGLMDKEYITDTRFVKQTQLVASGKAGIYLSTYTKSDYKTLKENNPNAKLEPIPLFSTKYGKNGVFQEEAYSRLVVMNKNTKNPKACVEFLDWMIDKGWFTLLYGKEGEDFTWQNNLPIKVSEDKWEEDLKYAREYALINQNIKYYNVNTMENMSALDPLSKEVALARAKAHDVCISVPSRKDIPETPTIEELNTLLTEFKVIAPDIENQVTVAGAQMTGKQASDKLKSEWKRLGGDKVNKLLREWYEKNKGSLIIPTNK